MRDGQPDLGKPQRTRLYDRGMEAHYAIVADPARDLVRITLSGFFDPGQVNRFNAVRQAAYRQLRCATNAHVTLCDVSDMKI